MKVKIYAVNQDTGEEVLQPLTETDYLEGFQISDEDELRNIGRVWIGGGAAQLFLLIRAEL